MLSPIPHLSPICPCCPLTFTVCTVDLSGTDCRFPLDLQSVPLRSRVQPMCATPFHIRMQQLSVAARLWLFSSGVVLFSHYNLLRSIGCLSIFPTAGNGSSPSPFIGMVVAAAASCGAPSSSGLYFLLLLLSTRPQMHLFSLASFLSDFYRLHGRPKRHGLQISP